MSASLDLRGKERKEVAVTSAKSHLCIRFDTDDDWRQWSEDIERNITELQAERNKSRVLYRDLKSRRKLNGEGSGSSTPSHLSGSSTPLANVDGTTAIPNPHATGEHHQAKDAVHSLIADKLRELQLKKEQEGLGTDEPSTSSFRRPSAQTPAYHTHHPSVDVDHTAPVSASGTGVGALEKRAWRTASSSAVIDRPEEISVRGMASSARNVCICADREEGRRNSALLIGKALVDGSDEAKEMKRQCPIHRLPTA